MTPRQNIWMLVRLVTEVALSYFLFIQQFQFLSILLVVAIVCDLIFWIIRRTGSPQYDVLTGHISYLVTLGVWLVVFIMYQLHWIEETHAFMIGFLLAIIVFPVVQLCRVMIFKPHSN